MTLPRRGRSSVVAQGQLDQTNDRISLHHRLVGKSRVKTLCAKTEAEEEAEAATVPLLQTPAWVETSALG